MAIPVIDMHCDTLDRLAWQDLTPDLHETLGREAMIKADLDNTERVHELADNDAMISLAKCAGQPWAQCLAIFVPDSLSPEQSVEFYNQVTAFQAAQLAKNASAATSVTTAAQLDTFFSAANAPTPQFAGISTIENARMFAADLSLVEKYAQAGVWVASISWNAAGPLASGHDSHAGLSAAGKQVLAEMDRVGMIFDVSHLNDEGFAEVAQLSKRPFIATHSNSRAVCNHPRNLTDEQFCTIRDRGGVVGLNFCGGFLAEGAWGVEKASAVTFEQTAAHIEHWLELDGEDTIALGSDWDGADIPTFIADASCMPTFQEQLIARFGEPITRKLCFENALRFFKENC